MNDYKTPKEFIQNQIKIGKQPLFGWFEDIEEFEVVNTTILYNKDDKENDIIRHFMLRNKFKNFLKRNKKYIGNTYSRDGVILLLLDFVDIKRIHIVI